ncbi:hypothetical protein [Acinetobacter schindleri]|uniref:hypothetical protein n=1 Tax=Acinetobacter schindleri TaxID=108981 RepID=UPI003F543FFE
MAEIKDINLDFFVFFNHEIFISDAKNAGCLKEFKKILKYIKNQNIVVASPCKGDHLHGRINILGKIIEVFSQKFELYIDKFYELRVDLVKYKIPLKLSEALSNKFDCYKFAQVLSHLYKKYDNLLEIDFELQASQKKFNEIMGIKLVHQIDLNEWKQTIEFIHFLSAIAHKLSNVRYTNVFDGGQKTEIPISYQTPINWCFYCFRRAGRSRVQKSIINSPSTSYKLTCLEHSSSNDKSYREAKRLLEYLSIEDRKFIDQIRAERRAYELLVSDKNIDYVTNEEWQLLSSSWINALQTYFPDEDLNQIFTWKQYVEKMHKCFNNRFEKTYNPRWIMDIFVEAEIWFNLEKKYPKVDKRRKPK